METLGGQEWGQGGGCWSPWLCSDLAYMASIPGDVADPDQAQWPWRALPRHAGRVMSHL